MIRMSNRTRAAAALVTLAILAAGCGSSHPVAAARRSTEARFLAYSRCMRSHGIANFPDPTEVPGGGMAFQINGGPGTDLSPRDPAFRTAARACRELSPAGAQGRPASGAKIATEVRWARCLRSHGVPGFPDPGRDGAFDSSRFQPTSPAFQAASRACRSLQPSGAVAAEPGPG